MTSEETGAVLVGRGIGEMAVSLRGAEIEFDETRSGLSVRDARLCTARLGEIDEIRGHLFSEGDSGHA